MNEKMNVLDVQLDNCTAKDAMKLIAEYMQTEELNTVDIVTVDTLMRATQLDGMKEELEKLDLLLPERIHLLTVSSDVFIILATSFTVYVSKESHLLKSSIHFNATFVNFYSIKM